MVNTCDTLMTDGFDNPDSVLPTRIFPGASANAKLDVIVAMTTVAMRLSLNGFD